MANKPGRMDASLEAMDMDLGLEPLASKSLSMAWLSCIT